MLIFKTISIKLFKYWFISFFLIPAFIDIFDKSSGEIKNWILSVCFDVLIFEAFKIIISMLVFSLFWPAEGLEAASLAQLNSFKWSIRHLIVWFAYCPSLLMSVFYSFLSPIVISYHFPLLRLSTKGPQEDMKIREM